MPVDLALILFGLTTFLMLMVEINFTYATQGYAFGWSANRPPAEFSPLARRIKNAYQNQVEAAAYGVPVLLAAWMTELDGEGVRTAALIFVVARAVYGPLYYTGVPYARLPAFGAGVLSIAYIVYRMLVA